MATHEQRIAIIGGGIAGLTCAFKLQRHHDVTLFEASPSLGGHAQTFETPMGHRIDPYVMIFISTSWVASCSAWSTSRR